MEENYWEKFEKSGKPEDYLNFLSSKKEKNQSSNINPMYQNELEGKEDAGIHCCDRYRIETNFRG